MQIKKKFTIAVTGFAPFAILLLLILCCTVQTVKAQIEVNPGALSNSGNGSQNNQTQSGSNNSTNTGQENLVIPPSWKSTYRDSIGDLHIVGQVQNNFTFPIQFVQITGTVYDSSHQLVSTSDTYTNVDELGPGEKSGFDVLLTNVPSGASSYAVSASYQQASASKPAALSISIGRPSIDVINSYHLLGEVTNQGNTTATFVKVSAVLFDANHNIIDAVDTFTSPNNLQPGQKAPFDLQSLSPSARQIKFVSINAQSEEFSLINKQASPSTSALSNTTPLNTVPIITPLTPGSSSSHHHHGSSSHHSSSSSTNSNPLQSGVLKPIP